jgi:hypothetical protein
MGETLTLEANTDGFVLTKNGFRVDLSFEDVLSLSVTIQSLARMALETRQPTRATATTVLPVEKLALNCDAHQTAIHLEVHSPGGFYSTFSLSAVQAQGLVDYLPRWIARIQAPKTHQ